MSYYTRIKEFLNHTRADGDDVRDEFDAVASAFDAVELSESTLTSESLRVASGTTVAEMANTPTRANKILSFDASGDPTASIADDEWTTSAAAALVSENAAAADAVLTAADVVTTHADVVLTSADVVSSGLNVDYSEDWAITPEDTPVPIAAGGNGTSDYSSLHWAAKALVSGSTNHTLLSNIGTNTHAQIDTHLALTNQHLDWTSSVGTIHPSNYANTTYTSSDFTHDNLSGVSVNEHLDWTANVGTIHAGNYTNTITTVIDTVKTGTSAQAASAVRVTALENGAAHTIFIPASAMTSRATNGAAAGSSETTTNKVMIETMDFDAAADEFVQFAVQMPKSWDAGTVTAQFVWSHAATTTNFGVRFFIQAVSRADGDTLEVAFGTAVGHTADTGGTTDDAYISSVTGAVTITGAGKSEYVLFQVYRDVSDAGDTLAVDARLHGVSIFYNADSYTDA